MERIDLYEKLGEEDIKKISDYYHRWGILGINQWSDEINDYIATPVDESMYIPVKDFLLLIMNWKMLLKQLMIDLINALKA